MFGNYGVISYLCTVKLKNKAIMRKYLFLLMMAVTVSAQAQRMVKTQVLKSTDLGNQKLEVAIEKSDTTFVLILKTGNRVVPRVNVVLGGREDAVRLLNYLNEAQPKGDDVIDLENPSHNLVKKNSLGGLLVFDELQVTSGTLRKQNIKAFLKAIDEYYGMKDGD